ncbi:MAG: Fe2+-dependent dioxygenase [Roseateles sp.]|uniref:Fe2+-dependent dioxygenase n=1 Tax=Roseateles sp. TaxID=1971397 RepID=UPI0039EB641E
MLLHVPAVLTRDEVAGLRERLDRADWADGRETVGAQGAQFKHNLQLPEASPVRAEAGRVVSAALERNPLYFSAALPTKVLPPRFNRYQGGGEYGFHVDGSVLVMGPPDARWHVRSDISCTLFLSDPDEYDGGELTVTDTYGEHEVKLPAGDMILYPSTSLHKVTPVTRGARVAAFFWVQSMVRLDWHRTMLFELDQTIQKLRARHGETPEAVALTSHYHNLLRLWAEV